MMDPKGYRIRPQAPAGRPERAATPADDARTHSDAPRPPRAAHDADPGPVGADSPYYVREWRGGPLYACPDCPDFTSRTHAGVDRHRANVHPAPRTLTVEQRARRAGIITAKR